MHQKLLGSMDFFLEEACLEMKPRLKKAKEPGGGEWGGGRERERILLLFESLFIACQKRNYHWRFQLMSEPIRLFFAKTR